MNSVASLARTAASTAWIVAWLVRSSPSLKTTSTRRPGCFDSCCTPRMITSYSAVPPQAESRSIARTRSGTLVSRLASVNMLSLNAVTVTWSFGPSAARNFFTAFFSCGIACVMLSLTSMATTISSGEPSDEKCSMV